MATSVDALTPEAAREQLPSPDFGRAHQAKPKRTISRAQLAHRIAQGEVLVLANRYIYKLDSWVKKHPGGELAVLHFVGRDASAEMSVYHSQGTLKRMGAFAVAMLDEEDWLGVQRADGSREGFKPLVPPIQLGYRDGKLDHPHAHDELWQRKEATVLDRKSGVVPRGLSPTAGSDSGYSDGQSSQPEQDDDDPRPLSFPLPVKVLEPPADPPGMDAAREHAIAQDFKRLHKEVREAGMYKLQPWGYVRECTRYVLLALTSALFWTYADGRTSWFMASAFFLGLVWHQLTFSAHDAGHTGITGHHAFDRTIGLVIADFLGGLSLGWWRDSHDVHHLVTNHPEHDPDLQHMPFLAVTPRFLVVEDKDAEGDGEQSGDDNNNNGKTKTKTELGLWSSYYRRVLAFDAAAQFFLTFQHKIYYILLGVGRFNLYIESYGYLATRSKRDRWFFLEVAGVLFFWSWFAAVLAGCPSWSVRVGYILVSHITTSPLHVQIVLSHFAQSSEDKGLTESFPSRQVRTTMDVECPEYLDFIHGGLHMQVTHHLFPRVPRHNLRICRDRFTKPFCEKWDLGYEEYQFTAGNKRVLGVLKDVADQVKILGKVAAAQARGEIDH